MTLADIFVLFFLMNNMGLYIFVIVCFYLVGLSAFKSVVCLLQKWIFFMLLAVASTLGSIFRYPTKQT